MRWSRKRQFLRDLSLKFLIRCSYGTRSLAQLTKESSLITPTLSSQYNLHNCHTTPRVKLTCPSTISTPPKPTTTALSLSLVIYTTQLQFWIIWIRLLVFFDTFFQSTRLGLNLSITFSKIIPSLRSSMRQLTQTQSIP